VRGRRPLGRPDGPFAWELLKEVVGVKVLGVRYLAALEEEAVADVPVTVLRAGKTGEYGYLVMAPAEGAACSAPRPPPAYRSSSWATSGNCTCAPTCVRKMMSVADSLMPAYQEQLRQMQKDRDRLPAEAHRLEQVAEEPC
jgi:hypothetical protein